MQGGDDGGGVGGTEHGAARHQNVRARIGTGLAGGRVGTDAAVHLHKALKAAAVDLRPQQGDLVQRLRHELLPAEARLHAHHQHQIQLVQPGEHRLGRGAGLHRQAHLAAQLADVLDGCVQLVLGAQHIGFAALLDVEGDQARARLGKRLGISIGVGDHQMHIVKRVGQGGVQALQHRHTKADVGHKVAIHHVIVQHLGAGVQHHLAVSAQTGEIGREQGRAYHSH